LGQANVESESSRQTYTTAPEELLSSRSGVSQDAELRQTMEPNSDPSDSGVPQNKHIMDDLLCRMSSDTNASQVKPIDASSVGKLIADVRVHDIGDVPNDYPANLLHRSPLRPAALAISSGTTLTDAPIARDASNNFATESKSAATTPNGSYRKRMLQEFCNTSISLADYVHVQPVGNSLRIFLGSMEGPPGSPYDGGIFYVVFVIPRSYPIKPPQCKFITKVYHPNIDPQGKICLDILNDHWSPSMTLAGTLISLVSLLDDPGIDEPLVPEIAELFIRDRQLYEENARYYTQQYARQLAPTIEMVDNCLLDMAQLTKIDGNNSIGSTVNVTTGQRPQTLASLFGGQG
jgi:ubiquitin-conjugating enzyme E2 D